MIPELIGGPAYAIGATALRQWKLVAIGGLAIFAGVQTWRVGNLKDDVESCEQRNLVQVSNWRAKYAEAVTQATQEKARIETAQAKISTEIGNDTQKRLDALRASLAGSLRAARTDSGRGGAAYLPGAATAPGGPALAIDSTVLDDAERCGTAYVIATGWQAWWREISKTGEPVP